MPTSSPSKRTTAPSWLFNPVIAAASVIILLVVALRVPSFAEPYWYGDEGIYLTIGQAMNNGAVLYKDIVDHKTPLIYYFARTGTQLSFRLLLTGWMAVTSVAFFAIVLRLSQRLRLSTLLTAVFVIATSVPFLEGNIPNGELFVMGFVLVGLWLFLHTKSGHALLTDTGSTVEKPTPSQHEWRWWLLSGVCLGGAILTKVPAVFDAAALFFIGWLAGWDRLLTHGWQQTKKYVGYIIKQWLVLAAGIGIPIGLSVLYFTAIGAGKEYLEFGLLYNFHYVQTWVLGYLPTWGQSLLSLPGKALITTGALVLLTLGRTYASRPLRFAAGWFYLAVFASILSNRPYPHYILQVVPPLILLLTLIIHQLTTVRRRSVRMVGGSVAVGLISVGVLALVWSTLRISHYPVFSYYGRYFKLATGAMTPGEYRLSFNPYLADNYAARTLLQSSSEPRIFIWGTNPVLYALSGKQPVGRFTVSFHIQDLKLYQETIDAVMLEKPQFIVVMHDEKTPLPGLNAFLQQNYLQSGSFEHFTVWRRRLMARVDLQPPGVISPTQ